MQRSEKMDLLRYMRPVDGLPDPRGQPSLTLPSSSIVEANCLVQEVTKEAAKQKKRSSAGDDEVSVLPSKKRGRRHCVPVMSVPRLSHANQRFSNSSFPYVVVNVVIHARIALF